MKKKLKIVGDINSLNTFSNDLGEVFFDSVDNLLVKEHSGKYIVVNNEKKSSRIYLSYFHKKEYDLARQLRGDKIVNSTKTPTQRQLFDFFPDNEKLIIEALNLLILPSSKESSAGKCINGLRIFLLCIKSAGITINSIKDVNDEIENNVYLEFQEKKELLKVTNKRNLHNFFKNVSLFTDTFISGNFLNASKSKPIKSLHSTVVYQLDYYASVEMEDIINNVKLYQDWMEEYYKINLFSLENIVKSYFKCISNNTSRKFLLIAKKLYGYDLKCWEKRVQFKYYYKDKHQEEYHNKLKKIALNGINIDYDNERMFAFWHKELCPDFPYSYEICPKYSFLFKSIGDFRKNIRRSNTTLEKFDRKIFPSNYDLYPLILFLLIRTGKNAEVLYSWKINLNDKGEYEIGSKVCDNLLIEGYKSRSNSKERTVLTKGSKEIEYMNFYLGWLRSIYKMSEHNNFFQSVSRENNIYSIKAHQLGVIFSRLKKNNLPNYFYVKHKIFEVDGSRINFIDHRSIRSYTNYADFLRGRSEFVRSFIKGHKNIDTQVHYENNVEWEGLKKYKIFKTQTAIIDIFRGEIVNEDKHPMAKLFNGPISDCLNPFKPDYDGAIKLKNNEACLDWFKCLTCKNSRVIPIIHGPVIYSWMLHMKKSRIDFKNEVDWEKEYFIDHLAAKQLFDSFNEDVKQLCIKDSEKYDEFVKIKFNKRLKVKAL